MMPPVQQSEEPLRDLTDEARRISSAADRVGVPLRVVGGVAVALRCPSVLAPPLDRERSDIDVAARGPARDDVEELIASLGWTPDRMFNGLNRETRLLFWDDERGRQLDVFFDRIEMCHTIDFTDRLEVDPLTLPLAELLLMKLQVMETNRKDISDILALVIDHDLTEDDSGINASHLSTVLGRDWCLWRTATLVAGRALEHARGSDFAGANRAVEQLESLLAALEAAPKTRRWKMRARVGERVRWYELPEEAH